MQPHIKEEFVCVGGPMSGHHLWLSQGHPVTIAFKYDGQRGRYVCKTEHGSFQGNKLVWRAEQ